MQLHLEAIRQIGAERDADGAFRLEFATDQGIIDGRLHVGESADVVVIWTGAERVRFLNVAQRLANEGIASLGIGHRSPSNLEQCVIDILVAVFAMREANFERILVAGEGHGEEVARRAADTSDRVKAVVLPGSEAEALAAWINA